MLQVEQMGNELDELDLACAALIDALELVDRDKPELVERARAAIENLERLSPC